MARWSCARAIRPALAVSRMRSDAPSLLAACYPNRPGRWPRAILPILAVGRVSWRRKTRSGPSESTCRRIDRGGARNEDENDGGSHDARAAALVRRGRGVGSRTHREAHGEDRELLVAQLLAGRLAHRFHLEH